MRPVNIRQSEMKYVTIPIGFEGENEFTQIRINCEDIFTEHPNAFPAMIVTDPLGNKYPVVVTRDSNDVVWNVADSDLTSKGNGEIQIEFIINGNIIGRTDVAKTEIKRSIFINGDAPESITHWETEANTTLSELNQALQDIPDSINTALATAKESGEFDGPMGPQGPKGDKGDKGNTGEQGPRGEKGDTGNDGYTPIKGVDYFDGAQGPKGDPGEKGETGNTGPQGIQGPKGDPGNDGYTPIKGVDYFDGSKGDKGDPGIDAHVYIRYSATEPSSDQDMKTEPDKWIGIYSGYADSAPTHYTDYIWYMFKGETPDISDKADKTDTVLNTTLSRGRKANTTIGVGSIAYGDNIEASGEYSQAFGSGSVASGSASHVQGYYSNAIGNYSHAGGNGSTASGRASFAFGGGGARATADTSFAIGQGTLASGTGSFVGGFGSTSSGMSSFVYGTACGAYDYYSIALGLGTRSEAYATTAFGIQTRAIGSSQTVFGMYNCIDDTIYKAFEEWVPGKKYVYGDLVKRTSGNVAKGYMCTYGNSSTTFEPNDWSTDVKSSYLEILGNGTSENARSNARAIDWDGNEYLKGDVYVGCNNDSTGGVKLLSPTNLGTGNTASGQYALAIAGMYCTASGPCATASGMASTASGNYSYARGAGGATATGESATAIGSGASAIGNASLAVGMGCAANGVCSAAIGSGVVANGQNSAAFGGGTCAEGETTFVIGSNNYVEDYVATLPEWVPGHYVYGNKVKRTLPNPDYDAEENNEVPENIVIGYMCIHETSSDTFDEYYWSTNFNHRYAFIVGNGIFSEYEPVRSNAAALEWTGDMKLAGDVYVGCNNDSTGGTRLISVSEIATVSETQAIINEYGVAS